MVLYEIDSNLIWATAILSKTKIQLVTAYIFLFSLMQRRGLQPKIQQINNKCSNFLKEFMTDNDVE